MSLFFVYFTDFPESVSGARKDIKPKIIANSSHQLDPRSCRALKMCTFKGLVEFKTTKIIFLEEIIAFYWPDPYDCAQNVKIS